MPQSGGGRPSTLHPPPSSSTGPASKSGPGREEVEDAPCALELLAAAASNRPEMKPGGEDGDHRLLVAMNKAEVLLTYVSVVLLPAEDHNTALACYQLVVGFIQTVLPDTGDAAPGAEVMPGFRNAHVMVAVRAPPPVCVCGPTTARPHAH